MRRYVLARSVFHERKTASIASRSCSIGSDGKSFLVSSLYMRRNSATSGRRCSGRRSGSFLTPALPFANLSACSNLSPSMPFTVLPNIWMNRRRASRANRSSLVSVAMPFVVSSLRPRFRTVSIMPGIENFAPERTLTRSGSLTSPNFLPALRSSVLSAGRTCSHRPLGNLPPDE